MKRMTIIIFLLVSLLTVGIAITSGSIASSQIDPTQKAQTLEARDGANPTLEARMTLATTATPRSGFEGMLMATAGAMEQQSEDGLYTTRLEDGGFITGNPDAPITIVMFVDALCPHCQAYQPVVDQVIDELVSTDMARLEIRYLPTQTLSPYVAQLMECVDTLSDASFLTAYRETVNIAIERRVTESISADFAEMFEIDEDALIDCAEEAVQVEIDMLLAAEVGVSGTPAVRVRYGTGAPQIISVDYARGPVPFEVLQAVVEDLPLSAAMVTTLTP